MTFTTPHDEQVFDEAKNGSAFTTREPYQAALYSSCRVNSPQAASLTCLASLWFFSIPLTLRSSMTMRS